MRRSKTRSSSVPPALQHLWSAAARLLLVDELRPGTRCWVRTSARTLDLGARTRERLTRA